MSYLYAPQTKLDPPQKSSEGVFRVEFIVGITRLNIITMAVMLAPDDGAPPDQKKRYELMFGFRRWAIIGPVTISKPDFRTSSAKRYIPKDKRKDVTELVMKAIGLLVRRVKPKSILMVTYHKNVPKKGLKKYEAVTNELRALGFPLFINFKRTDRHNYWLYSRKS